MTDEELIRRAHKGLWQLALVVFTPLLAAAYALIVFGLSHLLFVKMLGYTEPYTALGGAILLALAIRVRLTK